MRHSAAAIGLDEGTALAVAQELLGHSDVWVTRGCKRVLADAEVDDHDLMAITRPACET
jgi:site-specific recombinase XerD